MRIENSQWGACMLLSLALAAYSQTGGVQVPPAKVFRAKQAIPLPEGGSFVVTVEPGDKWAGIAKAGTPVGLKLSFEGQSPRVLSFALADVRLQTGEQSVMPEAIAVENEVPTLFPKFVLGGDKGRSMGNLGVVVRRGHLVQDGMLFADKERNVRFLGHTGAPLYIVFDVPSTAAAQPAVLLLTFDLDKKPFSASVKVR